VFQYHTDMRNKATPRPWAGPYDVHAYRPIAPYKKRPFGMGRRYNRRYSGREMPTWKQSQAIEAGRWGTRKVSKGQGTGRYKRKLVI